MAAITSTVQQVGVPMGALVLSGALQEWLINVSQRLSAVVQFVARDGSGNSVGFFYSNKSAGTLGWIPPGGGIILPVSSPSQSWWFQQDTGAATLYGTCQG